MKPMLMMALAEEDSPMEGAAVGWGTGPLLLFTVGEQATALVNTALALGEQWWGAPLPVLRLDVPQASGNGYGSGVSMTAGVRQQLTMLCAALVASGQPSPLSNGNGHGHAIVLRLWLVIDLRAVGNGASPGVGAKQGAQAAQILQMLDVVAWQRLQGTVRPRILLLAHPGDQQRLDECRQQLEVMAPEAYFVLGLTAEEKAAGSWQKAATTAAALFWGAAPLPTAAPARLPKPVRYYAVGAGGYTLPTAGLQQTLALWELLAALRESAAQVTETGRADHGAQSVPELALCTWTRQLLTQGEHLADEIPGPVAVTWGRGRPHWWRKALKPARMVLAQRQVEQAGLRAAQRQARQQWLATQLTAWAGEWQRFQRHRLTNQPSANGEQADVGAYETQLQHLWACVLAQTQQVDEALATLAEVTTQSQAAVQRCSAALDACCADLPTLSLIGIWQWCTQPKQWGHRLWRLGVTLPRRLHELARAVAMCEAAVYQEANAHLVRQLGLAILQDVQLQLAWLPKLRDYLRETIASSEAQLTEALATLPAPWTPLRVAALWQELADQAGRDQAGRVALDRWLQQAAPEEWAAHGPAGVVATLCPAFAERSALIEQWSAADWLAAMFTKTTDKPTDKTTDKGRPWWPHGATSRGARAAQPDAALWAWLDALAAEAQPHWPPHTAGMGWQRQGEATEEGWLLLPASARDESPANGQADAAVDVESLLMRQQREAGVMAWLKAQRHWQRGVSPVPALLAVRQRVIE